MTARRDLKNGIVLPTVMLPGERRMRGGKNLDGSFWIEIDGQGRLTMPPAQAMQMAIGILRAYGYAIEEQPVVAA